VSFGSAGLAAMPGLGPGLSDEERGVCHGIIKKLKVFCPSRIWKNAPFGLA
jgi:hypothetical protein